MTMTINYEYLLPIIMAWPTPRKLLHDITPDEFDRAIQILKKKSVIYYDSNFDRNLKIIDARFLHNRTLNDIAQEFNLSIERVRQISTVTLRRLKETIRDIQESDLIEAALQESEAEASIITSNVPISTLGFSVRVENALRRSKITTLGQLVRMNVHELRMIRNLGNKGIDEIETVLLDKYKFQISGESLKIQDGDE